MGKKFYGKHFMINSTIPTKLKTFFGIIDPNAKEKGLIAFGLQLLNNVVLGKGELRPPIREGRLRGSGSIFVNNKKVGDTTFLGQGGTPAQTYSEKSPDRVIVGFNTPYAARMHEHLIRGGSPDPWLNLLFIPHKDAINVGAKFLEKHLKSDKKELWQLYADTYRKYAGT